ncbi:unnamed protein product [Rotaria sordida]|uniref:serine--tRNA ligase n=1 Tax=Rotaria sordida TaxID=392033 RepID=A0A819U8K6_9BILA|nr:unnamed protein product [Rotaria sordida]
MIDIHTKEFDFIELSPPSLVRSAAMYNTGQLPKFADDSFETTNSYRLIPTGEVPLVNMVADTIISREELPIRYVAHTPCFRSEAGSSGKDTRGMIRLHQFSKVEKVDKALYNNAAKDFIPIACHYNQDTLLTKNGELLQTIQINGINSENIRVPIADLSKVLASNQYAVGSDKIEVIGQEYTKKFASIISIKEYHEVSAAALDSFLQLPVELIATEIFYFVNKKEVTKDFKEQAYILQVSKDEQLAKITELDKIMTLDALLPNQFCKQQISIAIIAPDIKKLEKSVAQASRELSKIGIVHVLEDINLEQTFWAQLPGAPNTGKTTLTNFLISEATKYDPTIVYITNNDNSRIFIEALEGRWNVLN